MNLRDVRAYAERDWAAARAAKDRYWASKFAVEGATATLAASEALRRHMRLIRPTWPSDAERQADFVHHVALKAMIDRAAGVVRDATGR
jgi:hypothetical protein